MRIEEAVNTRQFEVAQKTLHWYI